MTPTSVPFLDLRPGDDEADIRAAVDRVLARGWFVLGPELEAFEAEFAAAADKIKKFQAEVFGETG